MYDIMTGCFVKKVRKRMGWTRKDLAEKTGYSAVMIYKVETGERRVSGRMKAFLKMMIAKLVRERKLPKSYLRG